MEGVFVSEKIRSRDVCHSPHQTLVWWKRTEFLEFITAKSRNLTLAYRATNESLAIHSFHE